MKAAVLDNGVLIPKRLLRGVAQVDIRKEKAGRIVITPQAAQVDPIVGLGSNPVKSRLRNGAVKHDKYLYDGA